MPTKKVTRTQYSCARCGHTWTPMNGKPKVCPRCKSYEWDESKEKHGRS